MPNYEFASRVAAPNYEFHAGSWQAAQFAFHQVVDWACIGELAESSKCELHILGLYSFILYTMHIDI